jgi:Flp pilus assembly protein TadD
MGRYEEAIGAFNHAIEINPQDSHAWNRKGIVLKKIGKKDEAEYAFARAKGLGYDGW